MITEKEMRDLIEITYKKLGTRRPDMKEYWLEIQKRTT